MNRLVLAPEARSISQARHWVAARIDGASAEVAELLVSELVTNAVLHTGTEIEVALASSPAGVRVEVADRSPVRPSPKQYSADAGTGRGLLLVETLATSWGVVPSATGKVVWFTLPGSATVPGSTTVPDAPPVAEPKPEPQPEPQLEGPDQSPNGEGAGLIPIRLLEIPVALLRRASEQYDGLIREFRLIVERDPTAGKTVPARLVELADELAARFSGFTGASDADLEAALAGSATVIDLEYRVPPEAGPASVLYNQLLDEADAYCQAGRELLTVEPNSEAVGLRKWLLGEFVHQGAGGEPVPWPKSPWADALWIDDKHPGGEHARPDRPDRPAGP
ncbi:MAG: ATP-binding protein [Actinomycetota bacterium]|nr:ATP-binding protein [Actinomycetota bacterium]